MKIEETKSVAPIVENNATPGAKAKSDPNLIAQLAAAQVPTSDEPGKPDFTELAEQIFSFVKTHDATAEQINTLEGERRSLLNHGGMEFHAHQARLDELNGKIERLKTELEKNEKKIQSEVAPVRNAVAAILAEKPDAEGKELLATLDDESESAIARCELAAEFIQKRAAK